jgi:putative transposase
MFRRTSHAVYDCRYHVIWATKYRKKMFREGYLRDECVKVLRRAGEEYGMEMMQVEVAEDHVHLRISIAPQHSVGWAVRVLKSVSARWMFRRYPSLRRKLWGGELWGDGYFVRTVGEGVTDELVRRYIERHGRAGEPAQLELGLSKPKRKQAP